MARLSGHPYEPEGKPILDESGYMVEPAGWRKHEGARPRKVKLGREDTGTKSISPGGTAANRLRDALEKIAEQNRGGRSRPLDTGEKQVAARSHIRGEQEVDQYRNAMGVGTPTFRRVLAALAAQNGRGVLGGQGMGPRTAPERLLGRSRGISAPTPEGETEAPAGHEHTGVKVSFTPRQPNTRVTDQGETLPLRKKPLLDVGPVEGEAFGKFGTDNPAPFDNVLKEKRAQVEAQARADREAAELERSTLAKNYNLEEGESFATPGAEHKEVDVENPLIGETTGQAGKNRYDAKLVNKYTKNLPAAMAAKVKAFILAHPGIALAHVAENAVATGPGDTVQSSTLSKKASRYSEDDDDKGYDESQQGEIDLAQAGTANSLAGKVGALSAPALLGDEPTAFATTPLVQRGREGYSALKVPAPQSDVRGFKKKQVLPMSQDRAASLVGSGAPITVAKKIKKLIAGNPRLVVYGKEKRDLSKVKSEKQMAEIAKPVTIKPSGKRRLTAGDTHPKQEEIAKTITDVENKEFQTPYGGGTIWTKAPKNTFGYGHGSTTVKPKTGAEHHASDDEQQRIKKLKKELAKLELSNRRSKAMTDKHKATRRRNDDAESDQGGEA